MSGRTAKVGASLLCLGLAAGTWAAGYDGVGCLFAIPPAALALSAVLGWRQRRKAGWTGSEMAFLEGRAPMPQRVRWRSGRLRHQDSEQRR